MRSHRQTGRSDDSGRDLAADLLYYVALPGWGVPGLLDWWHHRRTRIEYPDNGGIRESSLHALMLAEGGIPIALALLAEINPLVLMAMTASAVVHEATARWDLEVADGSQRKVGPAEQQVHSVLEAAPFFIVLLSAIHAWPEVQRSWRRGSSWTLHRKRALPSAHYLATVLLLAGLTGALPYAEEMWRCVRARRGSTNALDPIGDPAHRLHSLGDRPRVGDDQPFDQSQYGSEPSHDHRKAR